MPIFSINTQQVFITAALGNQSERLNAEGEARVLLAGVFPTDYLVAAIWGFLTDFTEFRSGWLR